MEPVISSVGHQSRYYKIPTTAEDANRVDFICPDEGIGFRNSCYCSKVTRENYWSLEFTWKCLFIHLYNIYIILHICICMHIDIFFKTLEKYR